MRPASGAGRPGRSLRRRCPGWDHSEPESVRYLWLDRARPRRGNAWLYTNVITRIIRHAAGVGPCWRGTVVVVERVVVIGCAGSGKSTLARRLAGHTGLPLVERDGLGEEGSPGYLSAIAEMAARPRWILDGAPYYADELVYAAADTIVFLDYPKALVLWRALRRTASVEMLRRRAGAHRPQGLSALRDREHAFRWAWTSHADRHREGLALMAQPGQAQILRFTRPTMARQWLRHNTCA